MDVAGWLRNLGLEQYEAAFRDNAVNEKVLPSLTATRLMKTLKAGARLHAAREILRDRFAAIRAAEPSCLRIAAAAGLTEEAVEWWGRGGRSLFPLLFRLRSMTAMKA